MRLRDIYKNTQNNDLKISFEVFPPKDEEQSAKLMEELNILKSFNPKFISLTWGAGGNENKSTDLIKKIMEAELEVMPHFTCVCSSKEFVKSHIKILNRINIENILALRGDMPEDRSLCSKDFHYANELVEYLKAESDLSIGVAGYPEGHIESQNLADDIKNLKKKTDAGAEAIFTQLFFDNEKFFTYRDLVRKNEITTPIIPGILPILSKKQIDKMTSLAKITIPKRLQTKIEKYKDSNYDMQQMGIEYLSQQCEELVKSGVPGLHFFTLNKSKSTKAIIEHII